jgi:23S rRNA pseudouridine1911/1915/1917 synthase
MDVFTLPPGAKPQILSEFLRRQGVSLTLRRKLRHAQAAVRVNGRPAEWPTIVGPGDKVEVDWPATTDIEPQPLPLAICYEDDQLIVVDKPAGLLVHPTSGPPEVTLANAIVHHLRRQGSPAGFHPVHRLDRNTSGLILIAKNPFIHHQLSGQELHRHYLAVVTGTLAPPAGIIEAPIGRRPDSIILRMVRADGQPAVTAYEAVAAAGPGSLVRLRLCTGRTHQIRVHLAHIGHPLYGDDLYGGPVGLIGRQALHAAGLVFKHPTDGQPREFTSQLPADMVALLNALAGR